MQKARALLLWAQARYKRDFDRHVETIRKILRLGQWVYQDPMHGSTAKAGTLTPVGVGPHKVLANKVRTVVVRRGGLQERVNASRVTYTPPPPQRYLPSPYSEFVAEPADLANKNREGSIYVVEDVLDYRKVRGNLEFEIQWCGYHNLTWEPCVVAIGCNIYSCRTTEHVQHDWRLITIPQGHV